MDNLVSIDSTIDHKMNQLNSRLHSSEHNPIGHLWYLQERRIHEHTIKSAERSKIVIKTLAEKVQMVPIDAKLVTRSTKKNSKSYPKSYQTSLIFHQVH